MEPLNIRKLANAFVPYATPSDALGSAALSAVQRFKRKHGGLWVGGTVHATRGGVTFAPNGLNRVFHEDLEAIDVAAGDIKSVRHEFGWITGIVVVTHVGGEFRFRCYGAKRLAATLAATFGEIGRHAQA
jgi:hypothetical protein